MQTFQLPRFPSDRGENVTKLWLAPGAARVAAVLGEDIRYNAAAVCCDAAGRVLWENRSEDGEYPDPDFDRDLTRVAYSRPYPEEDTDQDIRLAVREIATGREVLLGPTYTYPPVLAPDGRRVYAILIRVGAVPRELRRWSLPAAFGEEVETLAPDRGWLVRQPNPRGISRQLDVMLTVLSVSPDGKLIAGGRYNGLLTVWQARNRKELMTAVATKKTKYLRYGLHRLTFSPDGTRLAALCERRKGARLGFDLGVWDVASGAKLKGPKEKESVNGVAFSPDGQTLLTAREDGTVGVWDVATRKLRREYAWKIGELFSVAFARDGLTCAAGGEKGRVVVWDADS